MTNKRKIIIIKKNIQIKNKQIKKKEFIKEELNSNADFVELVLAMRRFYAYKKTSYLIQKKYKEVKKNNSYIETYHMWILEKEQMILNIKMNHFKHLVKYKRGMGRTFGKLEYSKYWGLYEFSGGVKLNCDALHNLTIREPWEPIPEEWVFRN